MTENTRKKNMICKRILGEYAVTFAWCDGTETHVPWEQFPEPVRGYIVAAGLNATIGDAFSSADGNVETAKGLAQARIETLIRGETRGSRGVSDLFFIEAVVNAMEETLPAVRKWYENWVACGKVEADGKKFLAFPEAKKVLLDIKARTSKAPAGSLDDFLAG